jgi:hypothetical protein
LFCPLKIELREIKMKKTIGSLLFALSLFLVHGCGRSSDTGVIDAGTDEIADLETQMNADAAEADAAMASGIEE